MEHETQTTYEDMKHLNISIEQFLELSPIEFYLLTYFKNFSVSKFENKHLSNSTVQRYMLNMFKKGYLQYKKASGYRQRINVLLNKIMLQ